jgi:hypothetical protein
MGKRQRIKPIKAEEIFDPLQFSKNKCSQNARKVFANIEQIEFDIWFDKHYFIREQHGDDLGKREGIDLKTVQNLIIEAAKHLIYYSLKLKNFTFINFSNNNSKRFERIVLQKSISNEEKLNVIAEYHYLNLNKYEVTVKTAMRKDDFHYSDGQFLVEIFDEGNSILFKKELGRIIIISEY